MSAAERPIFSQREAESQTAASAELLVGRVPAPVGQIVEAVVILAEQLRTDQDWLIHEIGIGKPELDRFRIRRIIDRRVEYLALAHEIVLRDRELDHEPLEARIAAGYRQLAGGLLLHIDTEHDAVRSRPFGLLDLQLLLEEAEALD